MNIWLYIRRLIQNLRQARVFFGVEMASLRAPAVVFFPVRNQLLCCGLAGIMAIKFDEEETNKQMSDRPFSLFERICRQNLSSLLGGTTNPEDYLGGSRTAWELNEAIYELKQDKALAALFFSSEKAESYQALSQAINEFIGKEEALLESEAGSFSTAVMETITSRLILLKDAAWALRKDILENLDKIAALANNIKTSGLTQSAFTKYREINLLLNSLDRLEVRGRDSAGLRVSFVLGSPEKFEQALKRLKETGLYEDYGRRLETGEANNLSLLITSYIDNSSQAPQEEICVAFTYKTSSIVGELGRNARALRETIAGDPVFYEFASLDSSFETSLVHTRWASVGTITDANCHPVNNFSLRGASGDKNLLEGKFFPRYGRGNWSVNVAVNGDIDNYQTLRKTLASEQIFISPEVTTDSKIVPLAVERHLLAGCDLTEAFRLAVNEFEGSHAIALLSNLEPHKAFLALKGSGQSLYVGLAPDHYIFSSEVYGLVETTPYFIKMDGEKSPTAGNSSQPGQIFILDQHSPGGLSGIRACYYDASPLILEEQCRQRAEITTRDIDRGDYPHYFLKEISESAGSVHKTLRGKYVLRAGGPGQNVRFNLDRKVIPETLERALISGQIKNIAVIGHGTAAVAGMVVAEAFKRYLAGRIKTEAVVASELSGFSLKDDLTDTLVIPITQSGTTTDTNRAVAMARERGAWVVAIVNRRQSDITNKAHGVFYTSDGRDIEMSVASTKAFYAQIVAGNLLALKVAQLMNTTSDDKIAAALINLEKAPGLIRQVLERKEEIAKSVAKLAKHKKHWAVVGSGPNKAAAEEIRIKLSELCYKTISADVVENKKHIDLSAEPLIIVCAAGSPEAVMGDVVKDVAIFKAHKAATVVFADEMDGRFRDIADAIINIPKSEPPLPVILNTLAGHLWGYYAAGNIDHDAELLREFRVRLNRIMVEQDRQGLSLYKKLADRTLKQLLKNFTVQFHELKNKEAFSFCNVRTIADIALLTKYVAGKLPLDDFWLEFGGERGIDSPLDCLDITLGHAIDELSRPIDAIRHQAKTVTVGTSRKEEPFPGIIFDLLRELGFSARLIWSKNIMELSRLQPALSAISGYTLYEIGNLDQEGNPTEKTVITIRKKGGIALNMKSRSETPGVLMGTKRTIVSTGRVHVGYGKSDRAPLIILPIHNQGPAVKYLLLLHITFNENLFLEEKKALLGYRFSDIRNMINEYNLSWEDNFLNLVPLGCLLGEPIEIVADIIKAHLKRDNQV